jgi:hypothetical protein
MSHGFGKRNREYVRYFGGETSSISTTRISGTIYWVFNDVTSAAEFI